MLYFASTFDWFFFALSCWQSSCAAKSQSDVITCNGVAMVRETVSDRPLHPMLATPDDDDNYVYDLYYMNDTKFDFKALENILAVESLGWVAVDQFDDDRFLYFL